ncbi:MAG: hypothetical protein HQL03_07105 [Nitrospirae bacterium]|nr:hypothetical protein [Nitrospirota bacterium]MBF0591080.1 hypothetical protein [Nitrospirota bacterium]
MNTQLVESLNELGDTLQHVENLVSKAKHAVRQAQSKALQTETKEQYSNLVDWTQMLACEMIQVIELGIQETMTKCREVKELLPDDDTDVLKM